MKLHSKKTVAVIGAGVAGLATARTLLAEGFHCTVFERDADLGGVWRAGYSNFGVQVQAELYEFPDLPHPKDTPDFTPGPVVQEYLRDYAQRFGVWPCIRFNTSVVDIEQRPGGEEWRVTVEQDKIRSEEIFDLVVVCVGLYSHTPNIPRFADQDRYQGEVIHISELTSRAQLKGKKVVIVGYGKSATDAAVEAAAVAEQTTLVFRQPHWPVPAKLLGVLPFKWAMLNRLTSTLIPAYYRPSRIERVVHTLGKPLVWLWWRLVELLLIGQCKLGSRFGTRTSLVPAKPVEVDAFDESTMLPRPELYKLIRNNVIDPQRTEIAAYTANGVALKNGRRVDADVVVLATGWQTDYGFIAQRLRTKINFAKDGLYLYRHIVHPDAKNLFFIGNASTISNILTYSLQARWLAELLKGRHQLPSVQQMREDVNALKAWKREWMAESRGRGARLLLHMQHYHDELLRDFGADPLRKRGVLAPLKEVFAPYQPSDYRTIVSGEWAQQHHRSTGRGPVGWTQTAASRV